MRRPSMISFHALAAQARRVSRTVMSAMAGACTCRIPRSPFQYSLNTLLSLGVFSHVVMGLSS